MVGWVAGYLHVNGRLEAETDSSVSMVEEGFFCIVFFFQYERDENMRREKDSRKMILVCMPCHGPKDTHSRLKLSRRPTNVVVFTIRLVCLMFDMRQDYARCILPRIVHSWRTGVVSHGRPSPSVNECAASAS